MDLRTAGDLAMAKVRERRLERKREEAKAALSKWFKPYMANWLLLNSEAFPLVRRIELSGGQDEKAFIELRAELFRPIYQKQPESNFREVATKTPVETHRGFFTVMYGCLGLYEAPIFFAS